MKKIGKIVSAFVSAAVLANSLVFSACAEEISPGKTPSGISYEDIGSRIEELVSDKNFACMETAVFHGDDVLYTGCFGYSDRENNISADEETVCEWGSISKTFVWVSVMQLWEQGKIDLSADVRTYLPEGFIRKLKYGDEPVTMLNLMNHNAGWQETTYTIETDREEKIISLEAALHGCEPPQVNHVGEITSYSNWGAALAGYIVECVSGMDYVQYVHKNILEPLGMEHTSIGADYRDNPWVREQREKLRCYLISEANGQPVDMELGQSLHYILIYPAGSVTGTIGDMTKYCQAFVDDDCPLFENKQTLDIMLSGTSFYTDTDIARNCHGFWTQTFAADTMGHGGNTVGCSAELCFDKESKTGVVVMTNQSGETAFCGGIPRLIFGEPNDNPVFAENNADPSCDLTGMYVNTRGYFRGCTKILSSLNLLPVTPLQAPEGPDRYTVAGIADIEHISGDIYVFRQQGTENLLGAKKTDSGKTIMEMFVMDLKQDNLVVLRMAAVIVFFIMAAVNLIMLIVKLIIRLAKKKKHYAGAGMISLGQGARVISAVCVILMIATVGGMGFSRPLTVLFCILQMICLAAFAVSAGFSVKYLNSKDWEKSKNIKYILEITANVFAVCFVLYFELFNFWTP